MKININKSFTYVYPMIKDVVNYEINLMGCYIQDLNRPEYNNHIFLRYKFEGNVQDLHFKFEQEIKDSKLLETYYDISDKNSNSVMFVFKVPEEHKENYNNFLNSKYSQFDKEYKDSVINYHGFRNSSNIAYLQGVLYQEQEAIEALEEKVGSLPPNSELISKWESKNEFFPVISYTFEELLKDLETNE